MNVISKLFSSHGRLESIVDDGIEKNIPYAIVQSALGHYCAYVAVPSGHRLYGVDYENTDIMCNGGMTFSKEYENWWVLGWDYGHFWNMEKEQSIFGINSDILDVIDQVLR